MTNTKLIFSDVDNTLICGGNGFTQKMIEAMQLCKKNNIEFVLCSGRPTPNLIAMATELNSKGLELRYVAGYNGCEIYDLQNNEYIFQNIINDTNKIINTLCELQIDHLIYKGNTIYSSNLLNEHSIHEVTLTKLNVAQLSEKFASPKVLGLVNPIDMPNLLEKVKNELIEYTVVNSTPFFIEITNKGIDKGAALIKMGELLDINIDNITCFGDAGNDLSMFKVCPNGVAVENATDDIKQLASKVVDSVNNDGIAKYILKKLS